MDVTEVIRMKRAVREFDGRPLPRDAVTAILRAGRRAQSSKNTQPWHFVSVEDVAVRQALSRTGTYAGHIAGAPLGVAIVTPDPSSRWSILFDAGQAAAYMQLAAWEMGIGSCLASIYDGQAARRLLGFPPDHSLNVVVSFGFPKDPAALSEPPRKGGRRPAGEIVHLDHWGVPRT